MPLDLTLLYTRPTTRRSSRPDMVDLFLPTPNGGSYSVANYIRADHANTIIDAVQQHGIILDLLRDLVDHLTSDPVNLHLPSTALAAANAYLSTRRP